MKLPLNLILSLLDLLLLSPTSLALASISSPGFLLEPTAADIRFDAWCDRCGIFRVGVQTVTTPKSLGGRGLFATKPLQSGAVVASIPASLVLAAEDDVEWHVSLTNQVMAKKDDANNEWIQSWHGSGALEIASLLQNADDQDVVHEFVDKIVGKGEISREGAMADVRERIENYERRRELLDSQTDTAKWYTLVMSRAAYLGKDWDYRAGCLPFFDMLNHCHDATKSNTELMTFGDCLDRSENGESSSVGLNRSDMVLVLTKDVDEGGELLTQYAVDMNSEKTQLHLWMQYGIPPPAKKTG